MVARIIWFPTIPRIHSILERGVVASFLMIFSSRYLPFVLTAPNTPLVRSVMPMTPGMKKSMYRVIWVTIGTCCTLRLTVELERLDAYDEVTAVITPASDGEA